MINLYACLCLFHNGIIFLISVAVSPEGSVLAMPIMRNSRVGDMFTLTCEALGGPDNVFIWTRVSDNNEVGNVGTVNISIDSSTEGGIYSCNVSNAAGSDSVEVTINGKLFSFL